MGARVIVAASTDEKLAIFRDLGALETINYTTQDLRGRINELIGGNGAGVVFDPVGDRFAEPAVRSLLWRGVGWSALRLAAFQVSR